MVSKVTEAIEIYRPAIKNRPPRGTRPPAVRLAHLFIGEEGERRVREMRPVPSHWVFSRAVIALRRMGRHNEALALSRISKRINGGQTKLRKGVKRSIRRVMRLGAYAYVEIPVRHLLRQRLSQFVLVVKTPVGIIVTVADDAMVEKYGRAKQIENLREIKFGIKDVEVNALEFEDDLGAQEDAST